MACIPVRILHLKCNKERLGPLRQFLSSGGFRKVSYQRGVDGQALAKGGGRSVKVAKGRYRVCYDDAGTRVQWMVRGNSLAHAGGSDVWGLHACAKSHKNSLKWVTHTLQTEPYALVLEDDAEMGHGAPTRDFQAVLETMLSRLTRRWSSWLYTSLSHGTEPECHTAGIVKPSRTAQAYIGQGPTWYLEYQEQVPSASAACDWC